MSLILTLAIALLRWLASRNTPEATRARMLVAAHDAMEKKTGDAKQAAIDALARFDADGVSDDTHFRD